MTRNILLLISISNALFIQLVFGASMPRNKKLGVIKTNSYMATLYNNGTYMVDVDSFIKFKASFIQRWRVYQKFPEVKLMNITVNKSQKNNTISLLFNYFWNGGEVEERLVFNVHSIVASYTYTPSQKKNTSMFTCLFKVLNPKTGGNLKITGMQRHEEQNGALDYFGKWKKIRAGMKMISVRNSEKYSIDFIAQEKAWLNIWHRPHFAICNNGNYPRWDKSVYKKNEKYIVKYFILITSPKSKQSSKTLVQYHL